MNHLIARNNQVLVESLAKAAPKSKGLYIPETSQNVGIVLLVGEAASKDLKPGMKVYFGGRKEQIRINDKDVQVMEESNVYAIDPTYVSPETQQEEVPKAV